MAKLVFLTSTLKASSGDQPPIGKRINEKKAVYRKCEWVYMKYHFIDVGVGNYDEEVGRKAIR